MVTVYYARWILLEGGDLLENGAIAVTGNSIIDIGSRSKIRRESNDRAVNLGETLVIPGFINLHTHLEESILRGVTLQANETFAAFSAKRNNRVKLADEAAVYAAIRLHARELLAEGTTTILDSSRYWQSSRILGDEPIRSWIAHEAAADSAEEEHNVRDRLVDRINACGDRIGICAGPHAVHSLGPQAHRAINDLCKKNRWIWASHIAESAEELQAFSERKGDLHFSITRKKPWAFGDTPMGSMNYAISENLVPGHAICFHCNYASSHELSLLAAKRAAVVHCFRYSEMMGHKRFPLDVARNRRMLICLGTEGIAPVGGMSMLDELYALKCEYQHISAYEMVKWITQNPATALGMGDKLGSLAPGKLADMIAVRFSHDPTGDLLEELIMSDVEMAMVMVDGQEIIVDY